MIIEVEGKYHYNAPRSIRVGDKVELPRGGFTRYNTPSTWIGQVTGITSNRWFSYDGDIHAIVGKAEPKQLIIEASSKASLRRQLEDALDALEEDALDALED